MHSMSFGVDHSFTVLERTRKPKPKVAYSIKWLRDTVYDTNITPTLSLPRVVAYYRFFDTVVEGHCCLRYKRS